MCNGQNYVLKRCTYDNDMYRFVVYGCVDVYLDHYTN